MYNQRVIQARATAAGPASPLSRTVSAPTFAIRSGHTSFVKAKTCETSNVSLSAFQSLTTQNQPSRSSSDDDSRSGSSLSGLSGARGFSCSPISPRSRSPAGSDTAKAGEDLTNTQSSVEIQISSVS